MVCLYLYMYACTYIEWIAFVFRVSCTCTCLPYQISPAPDEMVVVADKLTFDLSTLRGLELLLVDSIDIHQLQGRSSLPGQIHALEIRRSLGSIKV